MFYLKGAWFLIPKVVGLSFLFLYLLVSKCLVSVS